MTELEQKRFNNASLGLMGLNTAAGLFGTIGNWILTEKNNKIQREREDTAMQRRMADLRAAGINPLMALNTSGASSSMPATPDLSQIGNGVSDFVSKRFELQQLKMQQAEHNKQLELLGFQAQGAQQDLVNKKEQEALIKAQTLNQNMQALNAQTENANIVQNLANQKATEAHVQAQTQKVQEETKGVIKQNETIGDSPAPQSQPGKIGMDIKNAIDFFKSEAQRKQIEKAVESLKQPFGLGFAKTGMNQYKAVEILEKHMKSLSEEEKKAFYQYLKKEIPDRIE